MLSSPPARFISELIDLLQRIQDRARALLELLTREQASLKTLALKEFDGILQEKVRLLDDLRALDERRAAVIGQLAREWAAPPETLTLEDIARRIGGEEANLLRHLRRRLEATVTAVGEGNRFTGGLIAWSLDFLHRGLSLLQRGEGRTTLYVHSGRLQPAAEGGGLVERKG